ncbi:MAG: outer membrane protein transport protein [Bacteroidales bacterium]|nr:outer membrane protein transport protein [Bacteroidales bacterium]
MLKRRLTAAVVAATTLLSAHAEGYQINTLSAKQNGMGHVGVAMKLGAESMIFNPAAMAFSDKTLDLTATVTGIKATATATYEGSKYTTENGVSTPLAINAGFRIYDNLYAGVSIYTPYGSSINWTDNWPGAVLNQSVDLKVYTIQPTFSWQIMPKLSVGAGLMITWGDVNLNKGLVSASTMDRMLAVLAATGASSQMGLDPEYRFGNTTPASANLNGTADIALGYNIGAMYEVNSKLTFGVDFRSKMMMKVKAGEATITYANAIAKSILESDLDLLNQSNFKAEMPCPYVLTMGVSYKPIEKLTLAFDAQLTGWKAYKVLDIEFLSDQLSAFDQHLTKDYKNAWCWHLGAQYALTERFDVRCGLMIDTTPCNDEYYNPETPGMTKIEPSCGFSFRPIPRLSIDLAFMYVHGCGIDNATGRYADFLAAKVPALGLPAEGTFTADYKLHALVPSIGISYSF